MYGALRRGLFASFILGISASFLAVACSSEESVPGAAPQPLASNVARGEGSATRAGLASLTSKATVRLGSNGRTLLPVTNARAGDATSLSLGMELPTRADGVVRLHASSTPERFVAMTPVLAAARTATIASDGSAVYERVFGSADLVQSATLDGLRTQIALHDAAVPQLFSWRAELGAGLRAVGRDDLGTNLVDDKGEAWLAVSPVTITDARGVATSAALNFDDDGYARLRFDPSFLQYPALIDFAVTLGNVQALAIAPTQIKGRVMVLLDSSGSMLEEFGNTTITGGDSPVGGPAVLCDNALGNGSTFTCSANLACTTANGGRAYWPVAAAANPSRMLASKLALQNVVNANAGLLDFGLERYAESAACPNTTNPAFCCNSQVDGATMGRCQDHDRYTDIPSSGTSNDLTYQGSCGTTYVGGRVLIQPGAGSAAKLLSWVDFVEDFCSSTGTVGGEPRNPELRGSGSTPLGKAVRTARDSWYRPTFDASRNMTPETLDDSLIDCRPYVLVVMTDGDDTCGAGTTHTVECAADNAQCASNHCFSADVANSSTSAWNCQCASNADCPGEAQTCTGVAKSMDCAGDNARCGAGSTCIDIPGNGDNWRCSCTTSADCGAGFTCNTGTTPDVDCRGDDTRCISGNCYGGSNRCSCNSDAQCPASQHCDVAGNRCVADGICQAAAGVCQIADPAPSAQVQGLTNVNVTNPVKTYVLGMGDPAGLNTAELDAMAVAGGTTQARLASSQSDIEAAFADIVANTVKYEICNGQDDNCNARIDEGLGVYQECLTGADCTGGASCNSGRCVCNGNAQCGAGFTCSNETPLKFCRPSCSEGQGACFVAGVRKCGAGVGQCCVNNAAATCTDIVPPAGKAETCNGIDDNCNGFVDENLSCQGCVPLPEVCDGKDNDCDGKIDETGAGGLVDIGGPCGSSVGRCTPGTAVCANGVLGCSGDTGPFGEVCNGFDDDCDGVVDGMDQACYTGPAPTRDVGTCHDGTQLCTAVAMSGVAKWGTCTGQALPTAEVCNGLDDDCDGVVDNGVPAPTPGQVTGDQCCGEGVSQAKCGVGECFKGTWACAGTVVVCANAGHPSNETCDDKDNDCNGMVDNIPSLGGDCQAPGGCAGTLLCDSLEQKLVCKPKGAAAVEKCNGVDDDCDGKTDEIEDVSVNDEWWGDACNEPPAGHDLPPCKPGKYVCKNGAQACEGDVQPLAKEVCDLKDNDCDGLGDTLAACPGTNACVQGVCVEPCHGGEFRCPSGYDCKPFGGKNYCVPTTCNDVECPPGASCADGECTLDNAGGASNGGSGGSNPTGGAGSNTGGTAQPEGGDNGGAGDANGASGSAAAGNAGSNGTGASGTGTPGVDAHGKYGLVTGGGGCACRTAGTAHSKWAALASLLLLGAVVGRRRRRAGASGRAA